MALPPIEVVIDGNIAGLERSLEQAQQLMGGMRTATNRVASGFNAFGGAADRLGRRMLPVSGAVAAMAGSIGLMVNSTTQAANEIRRFAQVSNTSTTDFQRLAAAVETVGMDGQGLADVFQDMNDRVGDFVQTGGGPMADFFENIAPQVGITADAFRDLSGPDALQLYVDSLEQAGVNQQDMAFYMEALSSNTTRLLPLLANGGAEMQRLGDAAEATGEIMSGETIAAAQQLSENMRTLRGNFTGAGQQISAAMIPVLNTLVEAINTHVMPAMQSIAGGVANAVEWFGNLPGPVQEAAGVIALALGVGGPVLMAIGAVSMAMGALVAAAGPVGLMIAAASALGAAWAIWGDEIIALVTRVRDFFGEAFGTIRESITAFSTALSEGFAAAMTSIQERIEALLEWLATLPERFMEFGRNIIQGLLDGINEMWEALRERIVELGELLPQWMREMLGIASPSRVMHEIGTQIGQGLANGIRDTANLSQQAMAATAGQIEMTAGQAAQSVIGSMAQMFQGSKPLAIAQALINTWQGITEALKLPFPANLAAAASVAAQGFAAVRGIQSTTPRGGTGGASAAAASTSQAAAAAPALPQRPAVSLTLVGDQGFSRAQIVQLAEALNDAGDEGQLVDIRGRN
jgi:methyl-accepting chemotaxis protein